MGKFRWQDAVMVLIGVSLAASPWIVEFDTARGIPTWNAVIVGLLVVVLAAVDLDAPAKWKKPHWSRSGPGRCCPPLLGFIGDRNATMTMMASGALVVILAGGSSSTPRAQASSRSTRTVTEACAADGPG